MPYKVFLVEDEIVAREGIRDNVDWASMGFEFCGDAPDGEMALPEIEANKPHVVITDIKMPFMDGLQLSKIIRTRLPETKIIILSGHDEFHYAQEAVKLGVTEYLLKPVGVNDLHEVLQKIADQLEQERQEKENLQKLKAQIEDNQAALRDQLLLKTVTGSLSSAEAIDQSYQLGIDLLAPLYLILVLKIELNETAEPFDYGAYQQVRHLIAELLGDNSDVFLIRKDLEELVLLIKGHRADTLAQEADFLTALVKQEVAQKTNCRITVGNGKIKKRLGDISTSFTEAQVHLKNAALNQQFETANQADKAELLKLDKLSLKKYLSFGQAEEFSDFFEHYLQPLSRAAQNSYLIKNYIFVDMVLTTAKFVYKMGGTVDQIIPEMNDIEARLMNIKTIDQIQAEMSKMMSNALAFRNSQNQSISAINKAKEFINNNFSNPDLSLTDVANHVNLSSSHLSTLFSQETDQTFKEYLTGIRIDKAKELLTTTALKSMTIATQIGYHDPYYFSTVFKKSTGLSPREFRLSAYGDREDYTSSDSGEI